MQLILTRMDEGRYLDLPGEAVTLLSNPPVGEKALLELAAEWPELDPALVELAESVRLFVLTWDPLDWLPGRPDYLHARNVADDRGDAELVIYFTIGGLQRMLDTSRHGSTVASVLGGVATELVAAAAESPAPEALPTIGLVSPGWEPIGLGAITDVAVHAFGPVDLDRSFVAPPRASKHDDACPACCGQQFGFIADLMEATAFMCLEHRGAANAVVAERFRRAEVSNRLGWEAIVRASKRLSAPMRRPRPVAGGRPGPRPGARPADRRRKRR
jgi:hypothetical protein